ncbi:MAG: sortase [Bacilli bacterium]|nr:sortase [Bacilli bacterium]
MCINIVKKNKSKKKKRISPSVVACIGTIIIIIGGFFLSYNYIMTKKVMVYEYMSNIFYSRGGENTPQVEEENINTNDKGIPEDQIDLNQYIGQLEIPKLNFSKGFYPKDSQFNDVDRNLLVVKESDYPNVSKGNLIIAGHSGDAWNSFFNDLYQLSSGDDLRVIYNNKTYTYKIVNIYKEPKVGQIAIYRNKNRTTLTLVTCTNNDSTTQTIYISELQSVV